MNRLSDSPYKTAYIRRRARESTFRGRGIVFSGNRKVVQRNIIALLDNAGGVVVQYVYDAWGNHAVLDSNGNDLTDSSHIGGLGYFAGGGAYFHSIKPNSPQYMKAVASGLVGARSAWQPFGMMANGIANGIATMFKCSPTNPFVQKVAIQGANVFMISLPRMAMRRLLDWMFGED